MCCCTALPQSILSSCINVLCALQVANNLRPDKAFLLAETVCNCLFPRLVGLLPRPCGAVCCASAFSIRSTCSAPGYCCCCVATLHEVLAHKCSLLAGCFTRSQAWLGTYGVKPRPCCVPRSGTPGAAAPGRRCRRTALARTRGAGISQHGPERCRAGRPPAARN